MRLLSREPLVFTVDGLLPDALVARLRAEARRERARSPQRDRMCVPRDGPQLSSDERELRAVFHALVRRHVAAGEREAWLRRHVDNRSFAEYDCAPLNTWLRKGLVQSSSVSFGRNVHEATDEAEQLLGQALGLAPATRERSPPAQLLQYATHAEGDHATAECVAEPL